MMRGLAEYIMRGRWQALSVAIIGVLLVIFVWVSAAAIALVTLMRGVRDGAWVFFWALLPAIVSGFATSDFGTTFLVTTVFVGASILSITTSLPIALIAVIPVSLIGGALLLVLNVGFLDALIEVFRTWLETIRQNNPDIELGSFPTAPTLSQVAGVMAVGNAIIASLSLMLARHWQALLSNPGGFSEEFHRLRLPRSWVIAFSSCVVLGAFMGSAVAAWTTIAAIPLTFCGFALLHFEAKRRGWGIALLVPAYASWLLVDAVKFFLLGLVLWDAWANVRARH